MREMVVRGWRSAFSISEAVSHGVFVPAIPADQNQYFLDGERIYNPSHQGGLLSAFNGEAFDEVEPRSGGIPPFYGGRIGGILDLSLREGSTAGVSGVANAGTLGSSLMLHGPVTGSTTFMLSGRQGYPSLTGPFDSRGGPLSDAHATELISKMTFRFSGSNRLFLTGYFGRDSYRNAPRTATASLSNDLTWRNAALSARWTAVIPPALFLQVSGAFTGYDFSIVHELRDIRTLTSPAYRSDYRIGDFRLKADAEHYYDDWHTVQGGVEVVRHGISGSVSEFTSQMAALPWDRNRSWEISVYMQDQWRLTPRLLAELGMRATGFLAEDGSRSAVDPRFSLFLFSGDALSLHASLTSVTQFLHPYRNSGVFLFYPSIFWYPSGANVEPVTSHQGTIGAEHSFGDGSATLGLDVYYRQSRNVHEFLFDQYALPGTTLDDAILTGTGDAWGMQWALRKRDGSLTGFLRYNLSWLTRQFDELNGGREFVPRFHRRHEVVAGLDYAFGGSWTVSAVAVVASDQSPSFSQTVESGAIADPLGGYDLNGSRLAGFQRVEIGLSKMFTPGGTPVGLSLRMVNAYGMLDLFEWQLVESLDLRQKWNATVREGSLFPKYPIFNIRVIL